MERLAPLPATAGEADSRGPREQGALAMGIWDRIRMRRFGRILRQVAPLLLMLMVAACGTSGTGLQPRPTATAPAAKQDIIPSPTARAITPTATAQSHPTQPPADVPPAPATQGRVILVSLSRQQLYAYEDGKLAFTILVETGRPELPTPTGVFQIFDKQCSDRQWNSNEAPTYLHNTQCIEHNGDGYQETFNSPWPEGSPYWYAPTHINYAMKFRDGGFYLHDAWWHQTFGPGSNEPHKLPNGDWETGSHGCVGMPTTEAAKLYEWAPIGTTVYIRWGV